MGSQAYGIGAGLQSLGNSMMQAMTMYSLLNEDPKEPEAQLTEKQKIAKKAELAIAQDAVDDSTMNTDEDVGSAYNLLNFELGDEKELLNHRSESMRSMLTDHGKSIFNTNNYEGLY